MARKKKFKTEKMRRVTFYYIRCTGDIDDGDAGEKVQTPIKTKTRWKSDSLLHRSLVKPITKTDKNNSNILTSRQPSSTVSRLPACRCLLLPKSYDIIRTMRRVTESHTAKQFHVLRKFESWARAGHGDK